MFTECLIRVKNSWNIHAFSLHNYCSKSSRRNFAFYSQSSDLSHHNSGVPFGTGRLANALVFITSVFFCYLLDLNKLLCFFCNFRVPLYPPEFSVFNRLSAFIIAYLIYRLQNHINFQSFIMFLLLLWPLLTSDISLYCHQ